MSFDHYDEAPPPVEPVRRDPSISITRDARPPRDPGKPQPSSAPPNLKILLLPPLVFGAVVGVLAFLGFLANAVAHAIMVGWNLWP